MNESLPLPLDPPALSLEIPDLSPPDKIVMRLKLNPISPYLLYEGSDLIGMTFMGYRVSAMSDIIPPRGDQMYRELELRRIHESV